MGDWSCRQQARWKAVKAEYVVATRKTGTFQRLRVVLGTADDFGHSIGGAYIENLL